LSLGAGGLANIGEAQLPLVLELLCEPPPANPICAAISPIVAASVWLNRFPRAVGLLGYDDELGRRSDERANI
jgi:hypothetical protein